MTSSRDENVIKHFFHNYLQDLGSEIALSIMVQEFTRLQNGILSVTPVSMYVSITALASATGEKRHPRESGGEAPRLHRTGGEAPCSIEGRKTRREENVFKGVENLPALLYTIV